MFHSDTSVDCTEVKQSFDCIDLNQSWGGTTYRCNSFGIDTALRFVLFLSWYPFDRYHDVHSKVYVKPNETEAEAALETTE